MDSLASWNDGAAKRALLDFIARVTDEAGKDFVPKDERIAVIDNDGTLWSEQPMYVQFLFAFDRIRELAPQHPEWSSTEPFASILKGDVAGALAGGEKAVIPLLMATHAGNTTEEFADIVGKWITTARHPATRRLYTHMVFQPMLELLALLRDRGFTPYIVSGGGVEFLRPWVQRVYGVPPQHVVGSRIGTKFEMRGDQPVLMRLAEVALIDDGPGKPVGIHQQIGRAPIVAIGNSDGDLQMLQWTTSGAKGSRFGMLIHHTDAAREFAYDRKAHVGKLDKALDLAPAAGWVVVDMAEDWKVVHPQSNPL